MKGCLRKIVIAQGGGPTAVINHTLVGLVEAGRAHGVSTIWGSAFGIRGIIESQFYDLSHVTGETLASLARQTGAVLGSTRDKPDDAYCREVVALCQRHHVDAFFYIGGNDTANTMLLLSDYALTTGYDLRCFHVPKTIDNDLVLSDHTPGFPSAARFVALAFAGLNADQKSLPGVHIGIVMGRHAGFLTASAALARFHQGDGPHILCLPEEAWHRERFLTAVKACYERYGRCLIACAEGVEDDKAVPLVHSLAASSQQDPHKDPHKDPHGNVQLSGRGALGDDLALMITRDLAIKRVRADTLGYMQRSFPHCVAPRDVREARDVAFFAMEQALHHKKGSVAILMDDGGVSHYRLEALEDIGGKTRYMPSDYRDSQNFDVRERFITWGRRLIGDDIVPPPRALRLLTPPSE